MKQLFPLLFLAFGLSATAQQTGDYTVTIATTNSLLGGDSLDIYLHVPETYSASIQSKMILGFHGLGNPDNSNQIRNYLSDLGDSLNAVVVCPDPYLQDQPRSTVVLELAYDSAFSWFNINPDEVYITGYSAGSDVAAQYVFGEPERSFKGLIWHSPGFFSSPDLSNPQEIPPVCLCNGSVDFVSIVQANVLNNSLNGAGFPYLYNEIPGVAHTMEYPTFTEEMLECVNFIDANTSDVGIDEWRGKEVSIYPNPLATNQDLIIEGLSGDAQLLLFDATGKLAWNQELKNVSQRVSISGFSKDLTSGIYSLSVLSDSGVLTRKVVFR